MAKRELADGTIVDFTAEEIAEDEARAADNALVSAKRVKSAEIQNECLSRISQALPYIDTFDELRLLRAIAPAFQLSAQGETAKDIYIYATTKLSQVDSSTDIAAIEAYDPVTDVNWPV